ncbi:MAG: monooxygenase [Solirubrobacterales bacterium]|nr:monooxygenase [Solirubrobacterales bacterium]
MTLVEARDSQPGEAPATTHEVVVVGAGFAGIGTAIKLQELGIRDYLVVEDGSDVGGTWHWNRYPGVAVDIPSFSYQFSFAPRTDWSRVYAPGEELRAYARDVVEQHGLRPRMRFSTSITRARFAEAEDRWHLTTDAGDELVARHVVLATGALTKPRPVEIAGVEDFRGETVHTARWDHDVELRGKRVAVIGTGASAVQLIAEIAPEVADLTVFQRTPIWCLPKLDGPISASTRKLLERVPGAARAVRAVSQALVELQFPLAAHFPRIVPSAAIAEKIARRMLAKQVHDPGVRAKLTPKYSMGCKRPSFHNTYLQTFNRPDVHLETTPIARVTATGVETTDGAHHEVDVLVLATGFKVFEPGTMPPFPVTGTGGLDLDAFWAEHRFQAYQGVSVPRFPNFFTVFGPYGYNGASYFTLIENQLRHITRVLGEARTRGATRIEVTEEANRRYFERMQERKKHSVLARGNCGPANSYYFDARGDTLFRSATTLEARYRSSRFPLTDYRFGAPRG